MSYQCLRCQNLTVIFLQCGKVEPEVELTEEPATVTPPRSQQLPPSELAVQPPLQQQHRYQPQNYIPGTFLSFRFLSNYLMNQHGLRSNWSHQRQFYQDLKIETVKFISKFLMNQFCSRSNWSHQKQFYEDLLIEK